MVEREHTSVKDNYSFLSLHLLALKNRNDELEPNKIGAGHIILYISQHMPFLSQRY